MRLHDEGLWSGTTKKKCQAGRESTVSFVSHVHSYKINISLMTWYLNNCTNTRRIWTVILEHFRQFKSMNLFNLLYQCCINCHFFGDVFVFSSNFFNFANVRIPDVNFSLVSFSRSPTSSMISHLCLKVWLIRLVPV